MWMHIVSICCTSMKFHCQKRCYTVPLIVEYLLYTQQYTVQQLNEKDGIIEMYEKMLDMRNVMESKKQREREKYEIAKLQRSKQFH
jgi:hypothetical protein